MIILETDLFVVTVHFPSYTRLIFETQIQILCESQLMQVNFSYYI